VLRLPGAGARGPSDRSPNEDFSMPPQRDQQPPPGNRRRRPEVMSGGWLWLLILLVIVFALYFFAMPKGVTIDYSPDFLELVQLQKKAGSDKDRAVLKRVWFMGSTNQITGELARPAEDIKGLSDELQKKLSRSTRFTTRVAPSDMQGDRSVTALLKEAG